MRLFILYNLQLEIFNFLYKNLRKAECCTQADHLPSTKIKEMKKSIILLIMATAGLFSCKQGSESTPDTVDIKIMASTKNAQSQKPYDKFIDTKYEYTDSMGKRIIIHNSFPKGGIKYTDPDGVECTYTVFFTRIINETDNPLELKINFPGDSYELPSIPGQYFKILLPPDTMTLDKEPLFIYGLTNSESFLDNNRNKSSLLNRIINPKESSGIYVVKFNIKPKSGWKGNGSTRAGFSLKDQDLYYKIKNDGSKSNSESSDIEIHCGNINLKNLILQK